MNQLIDFKHALGDSVLIMGVDYHGIVVEQQHTREGQFFRVVYWKDGDRKVEVFADWELQE